MGATAKNLDFTNVKDGGGNFSKKRKKSGDYLAKIISVEDAKAKDGVDQWLFNIRLEGDHSASYPYYCKLQENMFWKVRNLIIASGKVVPKKRQKVDPNMVVGKLIGVTLDDTEYENKEQSEITAVFPAAELGDTNDEPEDDDDEAEEADDDDLSDDLAEDEEPEEEAEEEIEDEVEEEEEEDEGDEWDAITDRLELRKALKRVAPDVNTSSKQTEDDIRDLIRKAHAAKAAPKKPAAKPATKAPAKRAAKPKAEDISDDELEELDIDSI